MSGESTSSLEESSLSEEDIEEDVYALETSKLRGKAPLVNDEAGLLQKLEEIRLRIPDYPDAIPWSEVLVLSSSTKTQDVLEDPDDDLKRENAFYLQGVAAISEGLTRLRAEGIPFQRPTDFYAEMIKSDDHMKKVKGLLLKDKRQIEEAVERRKNRDNKKFAKKVQLEVKQKRKAQKTTELNAIQKWRKESNRSGGDADFPEELLFNPGKAGGNKNNNDKRTPSPGGGRRLSQKAAYKAQRYGFGGKKRGTKLNTSDSAFDTSQWNKQANHTPDADLKRKPFRGGNKPQRVGKFGKGGMAGGGTKTGTSTRPGKRKRQQHGGGGGGGRPQKKARH